MRYPPEYLLRRDGTQPTPPPEKRLNLSMAKSTLSFVCQNCGAAYNRWAGKCEACGEWNTLAEEDTTGATSMPVSIRSRRKGRLFALEPLAGASEDAPRLPCGVAEFDRVTGGGFVRGSVLLLGGDPGIGGVRTRRVRRRIAADDARRAAHRRATR